MSQPISAKHLISQRSKPFNKAIIEEVTKEHFFTKGEMMNRRSSADQSETSFASLAPERAGAKNLRLRAGRNASNQGAFQKRSQSLPGVKPAEKIKMEVPPEAKVLCFCKTKHL